MYTWPSLGVAPPPRHNASRKAWVSALDLAFHLISINTYFFYKKLRSGLSTQRVRRNKNRSINVYKNKRVRQNKNRSDLKCSDHNASRKAWLLALDLAFHFISINTHFFYKKLRSGLSTQRFLAFCHFQYGLFKVVMCIPLICISNRRELVQTC